MDDNREQLSVELITETGQKSRGGLKDYSEMKKENVQRVRAIFFRLHSNPESRLRLTA